MAYVSIGLPVYNGERYLGEAIESLLNQTFDDFEMIITNNHSTDKTHEICEYYSARDPRIRYYRNMENLGAPRNFNLAFQLSRGQYFKWASSDDLVAPQFLERCVQILDQEPSVALCYPKTTIVDETGRKIRDHEDRLDLQSPLPHERLRQFLHKPHGCNPVFGLMRADVLATTPLIASFESSDIVLLAAMCLRGRFREVPERLFYRRDHPNTSRRGSKTRLDYNVWIGEKPTVKLTNLFPFAALKVLLEILKTIQKAPLSASAKGSCYKEILSCSLTLTAFALSWMRARKDRSKIF